MIDFRSDTVTRPTKDMLDFMMQAEVGDDVFNEDPTINNLQQIASGLFGMEDALFCPSGTMTNQIAIKVHTSPGDEIICDETAHVYQYEGGGIAFNSGCSVRLLNGKQGIFTSPDVLLAINPDDVHKPNSSLVVVENTSNRGGGTIWPFEEIEKISEVCRENGLAFHLDGARLFNALVETGRSPADYGKVFDSISICLSKGLGAPVGSLVIGTKEFIKKARRVRKVFGGGMRQAGYLAAAGIFALENNVSRLKEDHRKAQEISEILGEAAFVKEVWPVVTNIVVGSIRDEYTIPGILDSLRDEGILAVPFGHGLIRFVTHLDISNDDIEKFRETISKMK